MQPSLTTAVAVLFLVGPAACLSTSTPASGTRSDGGTPNHSSVPHSSVPVDSGPPYTWTCPKEVVLPVGTLPDPAYSPFEGNATCEKYRDGCSYSAIIPCADDAGVTWRYDTSCICVGGWSCDTTYWYADYCNPPPRYACPEDPLTYRSGDSSGPLPAGPCEIQPRCSLRTRQVCDDGSTGVTSAYSCVCATNAGMGVWLCEPSWSTTATCTGDAGSAAPPPDAGAVSGGDGYWIRVEGDGTPYELREQAAFFNPFACDADANLSGCYGAMTAPCLSTNVTPTNTGTYYDRNGDAWRLISTSIQPAPGYTDIGGPIAQGVLEVVATRPDGSTMHLTFTFHAEYQYVLC